MMNKYSIEPTNIPSYEPTLSPALGCNLGYGYCRGTGDPHAL